MRFKIREMRDKSKMTQREVAENLGVSVMTYGSWERGTYMLGFDQAARIADLFDCTLDELAGRDSPRMRSPLPLDLEDNYRRLGDEGREYVRDFAAFTVAQERKNPQSPQSDSRRDAM